MNLIDGLILMFCVCVVSPFTGTRRKAAQDHARGANNRETGKGIASRIKAILGRNRSKVLQTEARADPNGRSTGAGDCNGAG